ncbi:hypothetical protein PV781_08435 [Aquabacter sp. P-9]|nr:hypothetical protein [Aquabacter sp. P-9]
MFDASSGGSTSMRSTCARSSASRTSISRRELKREGRTLIVVSHDDRYFHLADRIVRMAGGRIVEDARAVRPGMGLENAP